MQSSAPRVYLARFCINWIAGSFGWFRSVLRPDWQLTQRHSPSTQGFRLTEPLLNKDSLLTSQAACLLARQLKGSCPQCDKCQGKQFCNSEHKWREHERGDHEPSAGLVLGVHQASLSETARFSQDFLGHASPRAHTAGSCEGSELFFHSLDFGRQILSFLNPYLIAWQCCRVAELWGWSGDEVPGQLSPSLPIRTGCPRPGSEGQRAALISEGRKESRCSSQFFFWVSCLPRSPSESRIVYSLVCIQVPQSMGFSRQHHQSG